MAGLVPQAIVLALGAGVLGGHEALRLLLQFAGHGAPAVDLALCIALISTLTAAVPGAMLLARFLRKARAADGGVDAVATDLLFARVTAAVSLGATSLVTACLLVVESGGAFVSSSAHHLFELGAKNPVVTGTAPLVVGGGAAAGFLPCCTTPLLRFLRAARNASGVACGGAAPVTPAGMRRFGKAGTVAFLAVFSLACLLLVIPSSGRVASGGEHSCSA